MDTFIQEEDVNLYYLESSILQETTFVKKEEEMKQEIVKIPNVTREPKFKNTTDGEVIKTYDGYLIPDIPSNIKEYITSDNAKVPSIFKVVNKIISHDRNYFTSYLPKSNNENSPDVYFTDGFVNIYSIKLINKVIDNNSVNFPYQKSIFFFGLVIEQLQDLDYFGIDKSETEKVNLDYLTIDIMNDQRFLSNKKFFNNIPGTSENLEILLKYFQNYFLFFNKIKEIVIPCLKDINLKSFMSYSIIKSLRNKNLNPNEEDVISYIEKLKYEDLLENLKYFSESIEEKIYSSLLDESINELDYAIKKEINKFKNYSIYKDVSNLSKFYLDYILLLFNQRLYKRLHNNDIERNNFHFFCYNMLLGKMRNFFVDTFMFCCCDKYLFHSLPNKNIFSICFKCSEIVCLKCLKFHESHNKDLCNFSIFEVDGLTKKLLLSLSSESKRFLEKSRKGGNKRKYMVLLDFIKFIVLEYLIKEVIQYRNDLNIFKNIFIESKSFIKEVLEMVNKNKEKRLSQIIPFSSENNDKNCAIELVAKLSNYHYPLKKSNKGKKEKATDFNISANRYLIEEIYYNIKSLELSKPPELIKSDEANEKIEEKMRDIDILIASKNSPKQLYRDLFFRNFVNNNFIENYFLPFNSYNYLVDDINSELKKNKKFDKLQFSKFLIEKINSVNNNNIRKSIEGNEPILNKKKSYVKKMTFAYKKINLNEDSSKLVQPDYDHIKDSKIFMPPKKSKTLINSKKIIPPSNNDESNMIKELIDIYKEFDFRNKIKIVLIFFEILVEKVENYGFSLNEEILKLELNKYSD